MDLEIEVLKEEKSTAYIRMPSWIRDEAKAIAKAKSTPKKRITESDVYRTILSDFFSQNRLQTVNEKE